MKYDVVIIGSGLGGLLCGNLLSNEGFRVCVVEKNNKPGGSLQTFGRKACLFNTGLNYTESMDDGQVLNQYFKYFGLLGKFKLKRLNEDGFDVIGIHDKSYKIAIGRENFKNTLLQNFPGEKEGLTRYLDTIRSVCTSIPLYTFKGENFNVLTYDSLGVGAANFIKSVISDYRLQQIVAGNNLLYAGVADKTPLYIHSLINYSFIESAWRIVDGSYQLVKILVDNIVANGGTLMMKAKAVKLISEEDTARAVELSTGEQIEGRYFISNTHPEQVLAMVNSSKIKASYISRIRNLEDTMGMFSLYIVFKKNTFPYLNYNYYHYNQENVWVAGNYDLSKWPQNYVLMTTAMSKEVYYTESASVLTYMQFSELEKWGNTYTGNRGDEYEEFKKKKAELLIDSVEKQFPGIRSCIDAYYTSTPLTWRDYTGTRAGSSYGFLKDFNKPLDSVILPRTKIKNLFLTGQNINVHGVLGVTISSVLTCAEILDINYLLNKIRNA